MAETTRTPDKPADRARAPASGEFPDKPMEPPADVTSTQEVERHDEAVREQTRNADKIREERRARSTADGPPVAAPLPLYPRENPWAAGATNNGDIGRTTGFTMPLYDRRTEYEKHAMWPTVGYRPGTEPVALAYSDQEPDLPPEPWRAEWRADQHTDAGMRRAARGMADGRVAPHPDAHRDARA